MSVVVTGAGSGLGREYALLFGRRGVPVVVNDLAGAEEVVEEIRAAGGAAVADVSDVAEGRGVGVALDAFGRVDAVVNNAGISGGGPFVEQDFDRMLRVHLGGTLAVCRAAWPVFLEQGGGRIVNTSSASVFGLGGTAAYVTAKAAIFGLTRALAGEGRRDGIKVNAVMPTALTPMTAPAETLLPILGEDFPPSKVAPFVVALASADVPVTGETFVVGGGRAARVVLGTVAGAAGIGSPEEALARLDEAMAGDVVVPRDAAAAVRWEREHVPSGG